MPERFKFIGYLITQAFVFIGIALHFTQFIRSYIYLCVYLLLEITFGNKKKRVYCSVTDICAAALSYRDIHRRVVCADYGKFRPLQRKFIRAGNIGQPYFVA